jgi:hypothetical protein
VASCFECGDEPLGSWTMELVLNSHSHSHTLQLKDTDVFTVSAGSQLWVVSWKTIGRGLEVGR